MRTIYIDFSQIGDDEDFYNQLREKAALPDEFGDNMDALYDVITGFWELPLRLEFVNMSVNQLEFFDEHISNLEAIEEECEDFYFSYFLEQYED
ncbi:MAG: barnase inhibitor [Flavobacteriales bacterium]|nr:MAG: barnase inhibitor [Flavobacteriales bacterium]